MWVKEMKWAMQVDDQVGQGIGGRHDRCAAVFLRRLGFWRFGVRRQPPRFRVHLFRVLRMSTKVRDENLRFQ